MDSTTSISCVLTALCTTVQGTGTGANGMDPDRIAHSLNDLVNTLDRDDKLPLLFQRVVDLIISIHSKVSVLEADNDACLEELADASSTNRALIRRLAKSEAEKVALRTALEGSVAKSKELESKVVHLTQVKRLLVREAKRLAVEAKECKDAQVELQLYAHELVLDPIQGHARVRKDTADSSYYISTNGSLEDDVVFDQEEFGDGNVDSQCRTNDSVITATSIILQLDGDRVRETSVSLTSLSGLLDPDIQRMENEQASVDDDSRLLNNRQQGFLRKMAQLNPFDRRAKDERNTFFAGEDGDSRTPELQVVKCDSGDCSMTNVKFPRWLSMVKSNGKIGKIDDRWDETEDSPLIGAYDKSQEDSKWPLWLTEKMMFRQSDDNSHEKPRNDDQGTNSGAIGEPDSGQIGKTETNCIVQLGMTPFSVKPKS